MSELVEDMQKDYDNVKVSENDNLIVLLRRIEQRENIMGVREQVIKS
ncbi:unnamed protein product (macronuclear) [Paramecium tetraurelia]|uniref:Uncharacterized protein n=1 Tax=Paramecium tetraurelia TaxID=5888 RepID=A0DCV1_PARTE|nr:uncharacterized protein GSPATT00015727001 [Paramecium tetraurelia]CAK80868.1 unnamed protein product [Paramecium tetraurelia]|eukprot:XP_001448265.1 hypothetical protein (macronuclear) [Paramecium tetraurelia strain d4-2]